MGNVLFITVALGILVAVVLFTAMIFRRVVPTNMVHIVQSKKKTVSYGRSHESGNVYWAWPSWLPIIGVSVTEFPESIFEVILKDYDSYDSARLPFIVDVTAFFRVKDSATAAQRVSSFGELRTQLVAILQGAVRRILATNTLEQIMEARAELGHQFTQEVQEQIEEWGVLPAKSIEFMDLRDAKGSQVIENIMEKEKSRIERESRIAVADNRKQAETAEIDAQRLIDVQTQEALQQVGIRTAEKEKVVGIAKEQAHQQIQAEAAVTTQRVMEVKSIELGRAAEIDKNVKVVEAEAARQTQMIKAQANRDANILAAEAEKETTILVAAGDLEKVVKEAQGVEALGKAKAESERLILMAPVDAQIRLATEIGENQEYQNYLVTVRRIESEQTIGVAMADAIKAADIKIIGTNGNIQGSVGSITDMFSAAGGTKLGSMLEGLSMTDAGKQVLEKFSGKAE